MWKVWSEWINKMPCETDVSSMIFVHPKLLNAHIEVSTSKMFTMQGHWNYCFNFSINYESSFNNLYEKFLSTWNFMRRFYKFKVYISCIIKGNILCFQPIYRKAISFSIVPYLTFEIIFMLDSMCLKNGLKHMTFNYAYV